MSRLAPFHARSLLPPDWVLGARALQAQLDPLAPWLLLVLLMLTAAALYRRWRHTAPLPGSPPPPIDWALAVALVAAGAAAFALLAWQVTLGAGSALAGWDRAAANTAAGLADVLPRQAIVWISDAGDMLVLTGVALLVALALLWQGQRFTAAVWLLAVLGNSLLVRVLKHAVERTRPPQASDLLVSGFSFPSGHAAGAMLVYGLLTWLVAVRAAPGRRAAVALLGAGAVAVIAASRVLLGVHYLSDVLGGLLLGALSLLVAAAVIGHDRHRRPA